METLSQLISYDELTDSLQMHASALVEDAPEYVHRGLLIDTSRNYFHLDILKGIVDAMSYNKMNVFHWHITDTHSFPLHLKSVPELAQYGAYSPEKTYSAEDVKHLVDYARVRGVKVLPEFDAPAHVGNGWQFAEKNHPEWGKLTVCVNQEPWQDYCVEPPCGQVMFSRGASLITDALLDELWTQCDFLILESSFMLEASLRNFAHLYQWFNTTPIRFSVLLKQELSRIRKCR